MRSEDGVHHYVVRYFTAFSPEGCKVPYNIIMYSIFRWLNLKKGINNIEVEIERELMCSWNDCMTYNSKFDI